ncbi:hypothetical protein QEH42_gp209 [Microbacterium phage Pumpernickel]|uniref:Uncharacterized protein n=1 Tax=Microbacterium phage Pumpernickel TaxID=2885983 RepID=A0AAE9C3K7_9CAUD|nr:hypothetical protein QEH42_gp209 [Microbacterium phage Pumpernickel]UDL16009.1 hypothetical protein SEA_PUMPERNICKEL_259 [Microbacterium phage Pumpernickel]
MAYGTAIVQKSNGRILDIDLSLSKEDAEALTDKMNKKQADWGLSTEWRVVKVEVL